MTMTHDGNSDASRVLVSDGRSVDDPAAVGCWVNRHGGGKGVQAGPQVQVVQRAQAKGTTSSPLECVMIHAGQ